MAGKMENFFSFMIRMFERYKHEQVTSIAGELSYFILLSLFPLLFVILQVISYMPINQDALLEFLYQYVPIEAMTIIETLINQIINQPSRGVLSVGLIGTLWTTSRGSKAIIRGMNRAFHVKEDRPFWKVGLMSLLIVIGIIFVVIFSLLIPVFGERILNLLYQIFDITIFSSSLKFGVVRVIVTFIVLYCCFTVAYYIIPNQHVSLREVRPGSLFATAGWMATSFLFSFYVENFANYSATYGSIGSIIVLMTWIYLSCIVLILGGILNSELILQE